MKIIKGVWKNKMLCRLGEIEIAAQVFVLAVKIE
jgi:hypothetical protein